MKCKTCGADFPVWLQTMSNAWFCMKCEANRRDALDNYKCPVCQKAAGYYLKIGDTLHWRCNFCKNITNTSTGLVKKTIWVAPEVVQIGYNSPK